MVKKRQNSNPTRKPKPDKGPGGAPLGNRNAAKVGRELRLELYLSKFRRKHFEKYFYLKNGRTHFDDEELRETFRRLAYAALDQLMMEEFERHQPGSISSSSGETF